tara:strand:+ start:529 stop:1995 length:1467 start_codon:yes stop_codon:yes gene_type:complete
MIIDDKKTLDPSDWEAFRREGYAAVDQMVDHLSNVRERPLWRPLPDKVTSMPHEALPITGIPLTDVVAEFKDKVMPYSNGNVHPRFFGWVQGAGSATGVIADLYASMLNSNLGSRDHAPIYLERLVINWMLKLFDMPKGASGQLVTGTSKATMLALVIARNKALGIKDKSSGLRKIDRQLIAYTSGESHFSVKKAMDVIGVGSENLHIIPTNERNEINVATLKQQITIDRAAGMVPFAIVAVAGAVNTGAIDPLSAIADLCEAEKIWFHVDGAFGGLLVLSDDLKHKVKGIERADSVAFDFHKWMQVNYAVGALLVRDETYHFESFSSDQAYLTIHGRGLAGGDKPWPNNYGVDLSRGFTALKVWFQLKEHGVKNLAHVIEKNCAQAEWLEQQVIANSQLEMMCKVSLNITVFRYIGTNILPDRLAKINKEIVIQLHEKGIAAPSETNINGQVVIRTALCNHRTTKEDLSLLMSEVCRLGGEIANWET